MAGNFYESMANTKLDFKNHISPILKKLYKNRIFYPTEGRADLIAQLLDKNAGIDYISEDLVTGELKGYASRIQRTPFSYDTFTTRSGRDSGAQTELAKRHRDIQRKNICPFLTWQAYVSTDGSEFLSMAITFSDFIDHFIYNHPTETKHTNPYQQGQASFIPVKWDIMRQCGYDVMVIKPSKEKVGYEVTAFEYSRFLPL